MKEKELVIRDVDVVKTWVLSSTLNFTRYFFKQRYKRKFVVGKHHRLIAEKLDQVLAGKITRLIINVAPRYSKTELAVKNFISMGLALNAKARFIHLSYSDDLALDNSKAIKEILNEPEYQRLFSTRAINHNAKRWDTNEGGGLYAVSSAGQVTGFGAGLVDKDEDDGELKSAVEELEKAITASEEFGGAIVIDDPIKPDDALSTTIREKVNMKFETTIRNRVNSRRTPIIIIMQRLNENDLTGYLKAHDSEQWEVLSIPCIYTDENGEEQALWPFKHTLKELYTIKDSSSWVFETQYMQNPKPLEGLMYENEFKEYETLPITQQKIVKNYTDTADTGEDFLCSICYVETEIGNFILDVLYTQKPMEYTEPKTAEMITKHAVGVAVIESNNGGRGFARNVEKQCRLLGNNRTKFKWFHQTENKDIRIFTRSAEVQNLTYFPKGWKKMYPAFANEVLNFKKVGTNAHDDACDSLTAMVEKRNSVKKQNVAELFGY